MIWMLLVFLYAVIKGTRDILKKKALEKNTVIEVLFAYTLFSFLLVTPEAPTAFVLTWQEYFWVALKSFVIFIAWICGFHAINRMPAGMYGILDMSGVIFSMILGMIVFKEALGLWQWIGFAVVLAGMSMLRLRKKSATASQGPDGGESDRIPFRYILMTLGCCLCNSISGTMDKFLTKTIDGGVLQFWYMLFLVLFYAIYILVTRTRLDIRRILKNYWVYILAVIFMIGDRALFIANADPDSRVTAMTLIKQSCCIVTIVLGRFVLKEKDTAYRLICAAVVLAGIIMALLG